MWNCHYNKFIIALTVEKEKKEKWTMFQQILNVNVIIISSLSLWLSIKECLNRFWMWWLFVYNDESFHCVFFSSFKINFDIKNRVILTSILMTFVQHVVATNYRIFLTRRRNEIFLKSWRFWSVMHNKKKKKKKKKKTFIVIFDRVNESK